MQLIAVIVCTRGRPWMFKQCLESLCNLTAPPGHALDIIVVENGMIDYASELVIKAKNEFPAKGFHYVNQPSLGIPQARNAGLLKAIEVDANWMGFIDDDEIAPDSWLVEMLKGSENIDILSGPVLKWVIPGEAADIDSAYIFSELKKKYKPTDEKMANRSVATNNVLFKRNILGVVDSRGPDILLFNEDLRFCGGEDTEFFKRAIQGGGTYARRNGVFLVEMQSKSRQTLSWIFMRSWQTGAAAAREKLKSARPVYITFVIPKVVSRMLLSPLSIFVFLKLFSCGVYRFGLRRLKGMGWALGFVAYWIFRFSPEPYRETDGF